MKDTKLYVLVVTLSARDNQKLSKDLKKIWKRFSKRSERSIVTKKKKMKMKIRQMNIDIFSNQILLELIVCLF